MSFQSTVNTVQGAGVPGELAFEGPLRSAPYILNSASAANNVFGRALTLVSEGVAQAGGAGVFVGIMANPKQHASLGTSTGALQPTLAVPNGVVVDAVDMGEIWVVVPGAAAIGDALKYNTTTGVIGTGAPGAGEAAVPNAKIALLTPTAAGLAVARLTN